MTARDRSSPLSVMGRPSPQRISKNKVELNSTVNHLDLTDSHTTSSNNQAHILLKLMWNTHQIDHILGHKTSTDVKRTEITQSMCIPDHLTCLLRNLYAGQEATVRTGHGQQTGSKSGKQYVKAVRCHPAYLTSMRSTSCEMLGWKKQKLESRLLGEISITSDMQMTPPLWQKVKKN